MKKTWTILILSLAVVLCAIVLTAKTATVLNKYKADKEAMAVELNFEDRVMSTAEWISNKKTKTKLYNFQSLQQSANKHYQSAVYFGIFLLGAIFIYCGVVTFYFLNTSDFNQMVGIALIVSSLCFLFLGLQAPFLEIEAFNTDLAFKVPIDIGFWKKTFEKTFDGKTVYFYQMKSVFQLIKLLFTGGNILVGIALLLFSVVFPLFKLLSSLFVLVFPQHQFTQPFKKFILLIGKWSMADVFVAGVFLAYFSFSNMNVGVETDAQTLIGLYFFLFFVILSISSSYFVKKAK